MAYTLHGIGTRGPLGANRLQDGEDVCEYRIIGLVYLTVPILKLSLIDKQLLLLFSRPMFRLWKVQDTYHKSYAYITCTVSCNFKNCLYIIHAVIVSVGAMGIK